MALKLWNHSWINDRRHYRHDVRWNLIVFKIYYVVRDLVENGNILDIEAIDFLKTGKVFYKENLRCILKIFLELC